MIKDIRNQNPHVILLDSGGFVPAKPDVKNPIYAQYALESMAAMGYDGINLNINDIENSNLLSNELPFVTSNLVFAEDGKPVQPHYRILDANGIKIGLLGIAPDGSSTINALPVIDKLNEVLPELTKQTDFVLLLSQLPYAANQTILTLCKGIDIVFSNRGGQIFSSKDTTDQIPAIVTINDSCSAIKKVVLTLDKKHAIQTVAVETITVEITIEQDPTVATITGESIDETVKAEYEAERLKHAQELHKLSPLEYTQMLLKQQQETKDPEK